MKKLSTTADLDLSVAEVLQRSRGFERRAGQRSIISRDAHHSGALPHQLRKGPSGRPQQHAALALHCDGDRAGFIRQHSLFPKVRESTSFLDGSDRQAPSGACQLTHLDDVHLADGLPLLHDLVALAELLAGKPVKGLLDSVLGQALEGLGELQEHSHSQCLVPPAVCANVEGSTYYLCITDNAPRDKCRRIQTKVLHR